MAEHPVHCIGCRNEWRRLPSPLRRGIRGPGISRLVRIGDAIAGDAGLPMPPTHDADVVESDACVVDSWLQVLKVVESHLILFDPGIDTLDAKLTGKGESWRSRGML